MAFWFANLAFLFRFPGFSGSSLSCDPRLRTMGGKGSQLVSSRRSRLRGGKEEEEEEEEGTATI